MIFFAAIENKTNEAAEQGICFISARAYGSFGFILYIWFLVLFRVIF